MESYQKWTELCREKLRGVDHQSAVAYDSIRDHLILNLTSDYAELIVHRARERGATAEQLLDELTQHLFGDNYGM